MSEAARGTVAVPEWWADEQYCYLTTRGRVTGRLHEIEIWFGVHEGRVYMISGGGERADWVSGGGERADWVKNLQAGPGVKSRVGEDEREARAHVVKDGGKHPAGRVLAAKYQGWREGWPLSGWAASALLVERPP